MEEEEICQYYKIRGTVANSLGMLNGGDGVAYLGPYGEMYVWYVG